MAATKPQPGKPKSGVPGVYYRDDGKPRWEVKIRWVDKEGVKQNLKTTRFPVDPKAPRHTPAHIEMARKDAEAFAAEERRSLEAFGVPRQNRGSSWTLRGLLERYLKDLEEGRINHKAKRTERSSIRMLLGKGKGHNAAGFPDIVDKFVTDLTYRDFVGGEGTKSLQSRLLDGDGHQAPTGSLKRVLTVVRGVFIRAQKVWEIQLTNPLQVISGLSIDDRRERTVDDDEWTKITKELEKHEQGTQDAIVFARWTAARRSEVTKLDWIDIDFRKKTARLRETKSRSNKVVERTIPLPAVALDIVVRRAQPKDAQHPMGLADLAELPLKGPVFTTDKGGRIRPDTLTQAWSRACARAGVVGARVHDLRHTRITELGRFLTAAEAARVSGHTDLATFFRYFNPDPVETGRKIDAKERSLDQMDVAIREAAQALADLANNDDFAAAIAQAIELRANSAAGR